MKRRLSALLFLFSLETSAKPPSVLAAAQRTMPDANWRASSAIRGDFACNGKIAHAILGVRENDIVIAIFVRGLASNPELLSYGGGTRDPETSTLSVESLDFSLAGFKKDVGYVPEGLRRSKTCKGIRFSDERIDAAHIYFNRKTKKFGDWSL